MDESYSASIFSKIVIAIFVIALFDLAFINWWIVSRSDRDLSSNPTEVIEPGGKQSPVPSPSTTTVVRNNDERKDEDEDELASPSTQAQASASVKAEEKIVVQTQYKEIFVPIGSGQSKSTSFADLDGAEVSIDTTKYGDIDYVVFEGSIWVEGGNGRAWAQVKNASDNNPLIESQITNPTATPTLKTSARIPIASGSKTYKIQAKTEIEEFAAHIDNGRFKIVLK